MPLALLVLFPILLYVPFTIAGHPVLPGDELLQNFPLRVLVGETIRSGRLPLWDPLIWSGTPLLAGWNAGAAFPGTWLFAFLGALLAWTINFVAVPIVASVGMYLFVRRLSCGRLAATLSALVFTYTGFMSGQIVHLGLIEGTAITPWILLALEGITRATDATKRRQYILLLTVSIALCVLAGDPRAVSNAGIISVVYLLALVIRERSASRRVVVAAIGATVLGTLISAIQWLPGLGFLRASQRSTNELSLFAQGSIQAFHLVGFLLSPFLIGGNGNLGLPVYDGRYNLPELVVGVGLTALLAACAYLPREIGRGLSWLTITTKRYGPPARRMGVWFVLMGIGAMLSMGTETPLGRVLVQIPLYGQERLQNRNSLIFDLALAIVLGFFVDDLVGTRSNANDDDLPLRTWTSRLVAAFPAFGGLVLVVLAFVTPVHLEVALGVIAVRSHFFDGLTPYLVTTAVLSVLSGAFALFAHRFPRRSTTIVLVALVVFDVALYVVNSSFGTTPTSLLASSTPESRQIARLDGLEGRFAIFNPGLIGFSTGDQQVEPLGVSDLNVLQGNDSVEGYGSIVSNGYQDATETHFYEDFAMTPTNSREVNSLNLKTLATLPNYIGEAIPTSSLIPLRGHAPVTNDGVSVTTAKSSPFPYEVTGPWTIEPGSTATWQLPGAVQLERSTIIALPSTSNPVASVAVRVENGVRTVSSQVGHFSGAAAHASYGRRGITASAILVTNPSAKPIVIGAVIAVTANPNLRWVLNGELQGSLPSPQWHYVGDIGTLLGYSNSETAGAAWLQPVGATTPNTLSLAKGTVTFTSKSSVAPEVMQVDSPGKALLVRSEAYTPGWTARLTPVGGGATVVLPVKSFGLIESVAMPSGRFTVAWRYAPRDLLEGLVLTIAGLVATLGFLLSSRIRRKRRALQSDLPIAVSETA